MTVEVQTTSGLLAALIAEDNRGSTLSESNGVYTVSHASKLTVMPTMASRALGSDYSVSVPYKYGDGLQSSWVSDIRDLVTSGVIVNHTFRKMVIEASGIEADYVDSLQPDRHGDFTDEVETARAY